MNLLDLLDEILLLILKHLNVVQTLDEQSGVHSRFDQIYVGQIDMTNKCSDGSLENEPCSQFACKPPDSKISGEREKRYRQ